MPLLTEDQLAEFSPVFQGEKGRRLASFLRKILSVAKASDCYDLICENKGLDFAHASMGLTKVNYSIGNPGNLELLPDGPFITISNHPYGGIDGLVLMDLVGHYRKEFMVLVNEFLALIEALRPSLIVVNPKNKLQNAVTPANVQGVRQVFQILNEGKPVGIFPAGAVSDLKISLGQRPVIKDREWQAGIINVIMKAKVPVVPIRFFDRNTLFFYLLGLIDWKVRLLRLPREVFNKGRRRVRVGIGEPIPYEEIAKRKDTDECRQFLRDSVYKMKMPEKFVLRNDFFSDTIEDYIISKP